MAKITIIRDDNVVYVDRAAMPVDCSHLPSYFHAIQWNGDAEPAAGHIEYAEDQAGRRLPNTAFSDFAPYQYLVDAWTEAQAASDAAAAEAAARAKEMADKINSDAAAYAAAEVTKTAVAEKIKQS